MSLQIHSTKTRTGSGFQPVLKSDRDLHLERETLRESITNKIDISIITSVYDIIKSIRDPEHPYTLEQLDCVNINDIDIMDQGIKKYVTVFWKPSFPTCGYATHIGLAIRIKIERELKHIKISIVISPGGHKMKSTIDKQLNDKERVTAAKENEELIDFIESLIS